MFGDTKSALCVVLCTAYSHWASAGEPTSTETCPGRDATVSAVRAVLGQSSIPSDDLEKIEISDLGERYIIAVKGRTREYTDEMRDCAKRARVAAVFVALTLAPPDIGSSDASQTKPAPEVPDRPKVSTTPDAPVVAAPVPVPPPRLAPPVQSTTSNWFPLAELGAKLAVTPFTSPSIAAWGGQFRGIFACSRWGGALGLDIPARSTFELEAIRIQLARYTADLSLRMKWEKDSMRTSLDLGPLISLLQLRQLDLPDAKRVSRGQAGLRAGAVVAWMNQHVSPFVGADVELMPSTIPIRVEPNGEIGRTSSVWLGISIGLALGSH